jgi:16S rRNA (cytosine967-C5)-methyltransferase
MAKRQLRMLARLSALVKPGGTIVYAVCSTEPEENEGVIRRFLDHHPEFSVVPAGSCLPENARQLVNPAGFFRSLVHRHQMDGFFIARLRKSDTAQS